jgi:hypothetical protein
MKSSTKTIPKTIPFQITSTGAIRVPRGQIRRLRHLGKQIEQTLKEMLLTDDLWKILIDHPRHIGATIARTSTSAARAVFTIIICTYKRGKEITQDLTWCFKTILPRPVPGLVVT